MHNSHVASVATYIYRYCGVMVNMHLYFLVSLSPWFNPCSYQNFAKLTNNDCLDG